jgi:carboxypeptidase family protein
MAENEVTENVEMPPAMEDRGPWIPSVLRQPLSKLQAIVGIIGGLLSVGGMLSPMVGFATFQTHGDLVGVIEEARSRQPILDATVEIRTAQNDVVTTLVSMDNGRIHQALKEGQYRVRVNHPRFSPEVRQVKVIAGQTSEVHLVLAPRRLPPPAKAVEREKTAEKPDVIQRFFHSRDGLES